jgi:hypothetical protein
MAFQYVPGSLRSAVSNQGNLTGALKSQSGYLNNLSGRFTGYADRINESAFDRLERYGEVSENDLVGNAVTDTTLAHDRAYDAALRDMTRSGINPNSGRFAGMGLSFALNRAAAEAGARNQARLQARNENYQRAQTLANLGQQYSSLGLNAAGQAASVLNSAAGNQNQYIQSVGTMANMNDKAGFIDSVGNYGRQQIQNKTGRTDGVTNAEALAVGFGGRGNMLNFMK